MASFKVTLAYDGTDYIGWQRQASGVSIQGLLEDALKELDGREVTVTGAGRTDAGVHALAQVAAFTLERAIDPGAVVRALNVRLPEAVRVLTAERAASTFNPRFDARGKTYRYRIYHADVMAPFERRYAWHIYGPLDVDAMQQAARMLEGTHDFMSFQGTGADTLTTVRTVTTSNIATTGDTVDTEDKTCFFPRVLGGGELVRYEITGSGFLRHMVRAIVGTLVEIGRGKRPASWMADVLASRDRSAAGATAPAHGLFLVRVTYE